MTNPASDIAIKQTATPARESAAADVAVDIRNVSKWFGDVTALDDVSFDIRRGEFFSLLGPSGCGKTTLLRMIGGFETPSEGQILIDGCRSFGAPPYARSTNMIFQHLALFPHMNVLDNVAFGLKMKRIDADVINQKVHQALDLVRLEGYGERKIDQLSGGQKQRVAMARAPDQRSVGSVARRAIGCPSTCNYGYRCKTNCAAWHKSLGNTFIFVTHDQSEAMAMSDRIAGDGPGPYFADWHAGRHLRAPRTRFRRRFRWPYQCVRWPRYPHRR